MPDVAFLVDGTPVIELGTVGVTQENGEVVQAPLVARLNVEQLDAGTTVFASVDEAQTAWNEGRTSAPASEPDFQALGASPVSDES